MIAQISTATRKTLVCLMLAAALWGCGEDSAPTDAGPAFTTNAPTDAATVRDAAVEAAVAATIDAARDATLDAVIVYDDDAGTVATYNADTGQCVTDLVCATLADCMQEPSEDIEQKCADGWRIVETSYGSGFKRDQSRCEVHFSDYYDLTGKLVARTYPGSHCGGQSNQLIAGDAELLWGLRSVPWAKGAQDACAEFRDSGLFFVDAGPVDCP